jgi:25S rRNA (cytosine2278-C5)-methyltransferase
MNVLNDTHGWRALRRNEQPKGLKEWHRRGLPEDCSTQDIAEACIRCEKGTDGTIGFFAVGFVRDTSTNGVQSPEDEEEEWQGIP